jgi:hypothetical protein
MRTSGLLFLFWLLLALCGAVQYHYELTVVNNEQVTAYYIYHMLDGKITGIMLFPINIRFLDCVLRKKTNSVGLLSL